MPLTIVMSWPWLGCSFRSSGSVLARRLAAEGLVVADLDRVGRVEADDPVVLDVNTRHAVAGRGHDEAVVEADLERAGLDVAVPVDRACAPGPGATCRRRPSGSRPSSARRQRRAARFDDQPGVARQDAGSLLAPGIFAGQQRVARGRAGRRRRVGVGEVQPLLRAAGRCSASAPPSRRCSPRRRSPGRRRRSGRCSAFRRRW